jgi:programmed cell death 6-interacting protein
MKAERDTIELELKSATIDMKETFINALSSDGAINEPAMSIEALGRAYGPLQQQVKESISKQENLLSQIQVSKLFGKVLYFLYLHPY